MRDRILLQRPSGRMGALLLDLISAAAIGVLALSFRRVEATPRAVESAQSGATRPGVLPFRERQTFDTSGFSIVVPGVDSWPPEASLAEIAKPWKDVGPHLLSNFERILAESPDASTTQKASWRMISAMLLNYEGQPAKAYELLASLRASLDGQAAESADLLYSIIYYQGVSALRRGENENCIMCRGESSCILPIAPSAIHRIPRGSRQAIEHFTEYLRQFPDDLEVRWLLNLAHMTLGEHPQKVDPAYLLTLDRWCKSEFDIGKFRDVGHLAGVNRYNQSGGAVMEDFDNDGLLDLATTSADPTLRMTLYHNKGDGTFEDRAESAGVANQLGGLNCVQTDYNNDGHMDLYIPRGAWLPYAMRPSLLGSPHETEFKAR